MSEPVDTATLPTVCEHGLTLGPAVGEPGRVRLAGCGETAGVEVLHRFLGSLHEFALELSLRHVVVDLEALTFINSSCLKALVAWIYKVDTTGRPYQIELVRNLGMHWQKGSVDTLKRLAPDVVRVTDRPAREPATR